MSTAKKNFLRQGTILAAAGILVRLIGMVYRIPMANIIGSEGNGIYGVAYNVYNIALVLSSYGLPMAVSKLVSARVVNKQYRNTYQMFKAAVIFGAITGGIAGSILFFGAGFIERTFYASYGGIALPLKVLAPTVFIVALLGVVRGFFQGQKTMVPTAVSQVIEQIVNAVVSIGAAVMLMSAFKNADNTAAYGAAGGTLGTCIGALCALLFLVALFFLYRPVFYKRMRKDRVGITESYEEMFRLILLTTVPFILGQTFYQISALFDDIIFGNVMAAKGIPSESIKAMSGVYSSQYTVLISVPMGIASSMAASMLPSVVASSTLGYEDAVKRQVHQSVKFNMMIAIPSAVGLAVLGTQALRILYPRLDYVMGGQMLKIGSAAVIFFALSTVTTSSLQAINHMNLPVIHNVVSLFIHIALVSLLLKFTDMGIYAIVIGCMTFPVPVAILNMIALKKYTGYRQEIVHSFVVPACCAAVMGVAVYTMYELMYFICKNNFVSVMVAVVIAMAVYFIPMYKLGELKGFKKS